VQLLNKKTLFSRNPAVKWTRGRVSSNESPVRDYTSFRGMSQKWCGLL